MKLLVALPLLGLAYWGISYDPAHHSGWTTADNNQRQAWVQSDFHQIRSHNFSEVKTYFPSYYGFHIVSYAKAAGLNLILGVPIMASTAQWTSDFINDAVEQAKDSTVKGIIVGNENCHLPPTSGSFHDAVDETLHWISYVKQHTSGDGIRVYTAQRYDWLLQQKDGRAKDLMAHSDYLGVNLYPFYDSGCPCDSTTSYTNQLNAYLHALSSLHKSVMVTETGWPTSGSGGQHPASSTIAKSYYDTVKSWHLHATNVSGVMYFQAYDLASAPGPTCEQHFGTIGKFPT